MAHLTARQLAISNVNMKFAFVPDQLKLLLLAGHWCARVTQTQVKRYLNAKVNLVLDLKWVKGNAIHSLRTGYYQICNRAVSTLKIGSAS